MGSTKYETSKMLPQQAALKVAGFLWHETATCPLSYNMKNFDAGVYKNILNLANDDDDDDALRKI